MLQHLSLLDVEAGYADSSTLGGQRRYTARCCGMDVGRS
jgi:hypothetical protein